MLDLLHFRVNLGFPTFFVKVRAHRGEPYNEAADRIASMATHDEDVPLLWNAPPSDPSDSEYTLYTASMNDTVKNFIRNQAAMSNLYHLTPLGSRNPFFDAPTAAGIFWVRVCPACHSLRKPRNDSYNPSASDSPAVPSFTNRAKKTPRTTLSVTRENLWVIFRAAVHSWKNSASLSTT